MPSFYIVDDDPQILTLLTALLEKAGHQVWSSTSSVKALTDVPAKRPDCIIVDIMMPELDGLRLCRAFRATSELRACKIIVVSAKQYDLDRRRALDAGADSFLVKPIDPGTFAGQVERILSNRIRATFWGVRGTLPVPGKHTLRYGGNTSCMSLAFESGQLFVFDAGTGIRELSNYLMTEKSKRIAAKIFITHPHWDHINALPHFAPLYYAGNEFEVLGPANDEKSMRQLVGAQMDGVFFPITMTEFGAHVDFRDLGEESIDVGGIAVRTMLLSHPGNCLGYRVDYRSMSICYVTDNELFPQDTPQHNPRYVEQLTDFVRGSDALVTDATYSDEEYRSKVGWGHSSITEIVHLAHRAGVKRLFLFHHDPEQDDDQIDAKLARARTSLEKMDSPTECFAPAEGDSFQF